ncbi:MAG: InlB B-repeat-containing protein [Lachnospiraceae bacterium]|nr:InlB B-repeat-containing protein [Lachnospiraceae bacterium]
MRKGKFSKVIASAMAAAIALTGAGIPANASEIRDYDDVEICEDYDDCEYKVSDAYEETDGANYTVLTDENGEVYDLGGMEIIIRSWFDQDKKQSTPYDKAYNEHKKWVEETYNFKIKNQVIGDWGSCISDFESYVKKGGDSKNYIFTLRNDNSIIDYMSKGYFYDLSKLDCLDFTKPQYAQNKVAQSYGLYAMNTNMTDPKTGVIFNKTLLEKCGVDVDEIYAKQKNGTWTWSAFENVIQQVQDYSDSNPAEAIIAFDCNEGVLTMQAMYSNTGYGIVKDTPSGFALTLDDSATFNAISWAEGISKKYTPTDPGDSWSKYQTDFKAGKLAFMVDHEYCITEGNTFHESNVNGEVGFVVFPKGPNCNNYVKTMGDNLYVIPSCYSAKKAWNIAFAYDVLNEPIKGFENYNPYVRTAYASVNDKRVANETLPIMNSATAYLQDGLNSIVGDSSVLLWNIGPNNRQSISDVIDAAKAIFQPELTSNNNKIKNRYNYYTVRFDNNGRGQAMNTRLVYPGSNYTFRKPFASGYIFKGWYTDKACTAAFNGTVNKNMTLYAKWATCKHTSTVKTVNKASTKKDGLVTVTCKTCKKTVKKTVTPRAYVIVPDSVTYTGKAITSGVLVVDKNNKAIPKTNYTLSFVNNTKVGKATVTVKFKENYTGTVKETFIIAAKEDAPKAVSNLSLKAKNKGFTVSWKSDNNNVKGYEVEYSKDKNFVTGVKAVNVKNASKKSVVVSKLTPKTTFYVRVRAYNTVGKNKVYSKWSKAKKITTK